MKLFCRIMGGIFLVLTIVFYYSSQVEVQGFGTVANIQGTVFCAACAVLCGVNLLASYIFGNQEKLEKLMREIRAEQSNQSSLADSQIRIESMLKDLSRKQTWQSSSSGYEQESTSAPSAEQKSAPAPEVRKTVAENDKMEWTEDGVDFVRCPQCKNKMRRDYINERKVCPYCAHEFKE